MGPGLTPYHSSCGQAAIKEWGTQANKQRQAPLAAWLSWLTLASTFHTCLRPCIEIHVWNADGISTGAPVNYAFYTYNTTRKPSIVRMSHELRAPYVRVEQRHTSSKGSGFSPTAARMRMTNSGNHSVTYHQHDALCKSYLAKALYILCNR